MNKNSSPTTSRWRRKILGVPVAWIVGITSTALAVVGFAIILGVTGTLSSADGFDVQYNTHVNNGGTPITGSPTCDFTYVGVNEVQFGMSDALPGDVCRYRIETANVGAEDAQLNGFVLGSADFVASVNTGTPDAQCGYTLVATTGVKFVDVDIEASNTIAPGTTYNLLLASDGFDWRVPSLYNAGECS